jgi:hypothetical protein
VGGFEGAGGASQDKGYNRIHGCGRKGSGALPLPRAAAVSTGCSVQEVASPRAEHDVHGEGDGAAAAEQLADARRRATLEQAVAQLDTRRTARFGSDRGGNAVGAHLQPGRPGGAGARPVAVAPPGEERGACSNGGGTSDHEEAGVRQLARRLPECRHTVQVLSQPGAPRGGC